MKSKFVLNQDKLQNQCGCCNSGSSVNSIQVYDHVSQNVQKAAHQKRTKLRTPSLNLLNLMKGHMQSKLSRTCEQKLCEQTRALCPAQHNRCRNHLSRTATQFWMKDLMRRVEGRQELRAKRKRPLAIIQAQFAINSMSCMPRCSSQCAGIRGVVGAIRGHHISLATSMRWGSLVEIKECQLVQKYEFAEVAAKLSSIQVGRKSWLEHKIGVRNEQGGSLRCKVQEGFRLSTAN